MEDIPRTSMGLVNWSEMNRRAAELLATFHVPIDPKALVRDLTVAEQQIVAIVKALSQDSKVLIMDEPSAVLTGSELERLFEIIGTLKKQGVGIVYITHRLVEVFEIGDRITVLRDGQWIATSNVEDVTMEQMISWMVGRELGEQFYKEKVEIGDVVLEEGSAGGGQNRTVSFQLREGEILGIAGLVGAGRTELLKTLLGLIRDQRHHHHLREECRIKSPRCHQKRLRLGSGRQEDGRGCACRSIEEHLRGHPGQRKYKFLVRYRTVCTHR